MCTIFKGITYVIGVIRKHEVNEILEIAKDLDLKIYYPEMFENVDEDLYRIAISDEGFGGFVCTIICWQELTVKKNKKWGYFNDIKELKAYIAKTRKENDQ